MAAETVLVVGGTGMLGRQVAEQLQARGKQVRALVRPTSNTEALTELRAELVTADLLKAETLRVALDGVDAVVTTAAGYTRHTAGDTIETDHSGNRNLADAAVAAGVRRLVFTSILNCHLARDVPHFWAKKLAEDYFEELGLPFVSLRPGAFVDYFGLSGGVDGFTAGRITAIGDVDVRFTRVYTPDLAANLAAAVDADVAPGERVDIGWDLAPTTRELTELASQILGRDLELTAVDLAQMRAPDMPEEAYRDFAAMFEFFLSGRYVADTTRQRQVFGAVPGAEETMRRRLAALGHVAAP
ncbi:MAG: SDR family oxidoreductase [Candidatus Dormibacteraeota bacterium]|nr:SDR family oxidoreductase [Candidatus Dormibacteraeota bacterium]MBV9524980.1 SDR family oxidoreductase [Candidatus Dormibacteraeota bacterium]